VKVESTQVIQRNMHQLAPLLLMISRYYVRSFHCQGITKSQASFCD